jgi:hypothetical protein
MGENSNAYIGGKARRNETTRKTKRQVEGSCEHGNDPLVSIE